MRRFIISDIHGSLKALLQVFEKSGFDYKEDKLICLGDTVDSGAESYECIEELMKIKNLIYVLGNHDFWLYNYFLNGIKEDMWIKQGGEQTLLSYDKEKKIDHHIEFFRNAVYYHEEDNMLFVHGSFDVKSPIKDQKKVFLLFDRGIIQVAMHKMAMHKTHGHPKKISKEYKEIFVGHTATTTMSKEYEIDKPINICELWMMDTGAGWGDGKLTIMNIDTKEFFQSDVANVLYPEHEFRNNLKNERQSY